MLKSLLGSVLTKNMWENAENALFSQLWGCILYVTPCTFRILHKFYDFAVKLRILHGYPRWIDLACRFKEMPEKGLLFRKRSTSCVQNFLKYQGMTCMKFHQNCCTKNILKLNFFKTENFAPVMRN